MGRVRPVRADRRDAALGEEVAEQAELGVAVVLDGRMVVHVVAREVGVAGGGEPDAVKPALVEAVARRLHREMRDALACELVEAPVQRDRVGGRQRAVSAARGLRHAERAEARGLMAGRGPDLAEESDGRTFAAGAGHRGDDGRLEGMESCGRERQFAPRVHLAHDRDRGFDRRLAQNRCRAGLDGRGDEARAVGLGP